jgi:hypothetical protein
MKDILLHLISALRLMIIKLLLGDYLRGSEFLGHLRLGELLELPSVHIHLQERDTNLQA